MTLCLLVWLVIGVSANAAADVVCGMTLTADVKLDHDLVCSGDGLIVGADGITIDLNGHTMAGSGIGVGILVIGHADVTVARGVLRNFAVALQLNTASGIVIRHNQFIENAEGIDLQAGSIGNSVKENLFQDSTIRAIMLRSNSVDNDIKNNILIRNRLGIQVFGGVDNEVKDNDISGSSTAGIRFGIAATGNVVKNNTIGASAAGFEFVVMSGLSAVGNELKDNILAGNSCGLKGPTAGNILRNNSLEGNLTDTCP
jgi:parallel beta-helix repeat protein